MKRLAVLLAPIITYGCATNVTMTGTAYPAVPPEKVKLVFHEKPKCKDLKELAFISTPYKWNQDGAMNAAREKAANIGADYLMIQTVNSNTYNDVRVSGLAYKCINE